MKHILLDDKANKFRRRLEGSIKFGRSNSFPGLLRNQVEGLTRFCGPFGAGSKLQKLFARIPIPCMVPTMVVLCWAHVS